MFSVRHTRPSPPPKKAHLCGSLPIRHPIPHNNYRPAQTQQRQQLQQQLQQSQQRQQQRLRCRAAANANAAAPSRRAALASAAALLAAAAAGLPPPPAARAAAGPSLCVESESADLASDCRRAALAADTDKQLTYGQAAARSADSERPAAGVPVAKLDSKYARDTAGLSRGIAAYVAIPSDDARARAPMVKPLRAECQQWASQYARGGSARSQSARAMYVAVDAVMGHLASNGIAPLPGAKRAEVGASLEASARYLAEGR